MGETIAVGTEVDVAGRAKIGEGVGAVPEHAAATVTSRPSKQIATHRRLGAVAGIGSDVGGEVDSPICAGTTKNMGSHKGPEDLVGRHRKALITRFLCSG